MTSEATRSTTRSDETSVTSERCALFLFHEVAPCEWSGHAPAVTHPVQPPSRRVLIVIASPWRWLSSARLPTPAGLGATNETGAAAVAAVT